MSVYIRGIAVFNETGEKRFVPFQQGLNVITGDSKSGKSALLEIIDYCMGSSLSTIPKGKISEFSHLYALILQSREMSVVLARRLFTHDGSTRMFLKLETNGISIEQLNYDYFTEVHFDLKSRIMSRLEAILGLSITDMTEDSTGDRDGKPSVRNMMSYLLQHQNLVANKHALFYRFDNTFKRKDVIRQLPVFAGWVDQKYYLMLYELDEKEKELRRRLRESRVSKQFLEDKKRELSVTFHKYYTLLGRKFDDTASLEELLKLHSNLPNFTRTSYLSTGVEEQRVLLESRLEELRLERQKYDRQISELEIGQGDSEGYEDQLSQMHKKANAIHAITDTISCPLCGQVHNELSETVLQIQHSRDWLNKELAQLRYHQGLFTEQIRELKKKRRVIQRGIVSTVRRINELMAITAEIEERQKSLQEQILYAKAQIDVHVDLIRNQIGAIRSDGDIEQLQQDIQRLKRYIDGYSLNDYYARASARMSTIMNEIVRDLDFEEDFNPPNLVLELRETFDLYHHDTKTRQKVFLSEMGSGANWLSCHLAVFLSFQRFFAEQKKSNMPNFLFLDQPSQVYFPESADEGDDIEGKNDFGRVKRIYATILREIDAVERDTGAKPQVIVTDHVGDLTLDGYEFKQYVRRRWRGEDKFI